MLTQRQLFLQHNAQTTFFPLLLEIERASGIYLWDIHQKQYIDFISGIAVSNVGHCNPDVVKAIEEQSKKYMHLMVYGEYVQSPQVLFAQKLCEQLPNQLSSVYFVNSGAEAIEGAIKLAKRYTARAETISCVNAYHGSTQGALSVMGNELFKQAFRPLIPGNKLIRFGHVEDLSMIDEHTAAVIIETVQGESGINVANPSYFKALRDICSAKGVLLIADEIQCGMGRTGRMFAFEHYDFVPDVLCLSKSLGGGMPIGAFIASKPLMETLAYAPMLGHITTFGGHPVSCAAGLAALNFTIKNHLIEQVEEKHQLLKSLLNHSAIKEIRGVGLMLALQFESFALNKKIIDRCIHNGLITDWFLFCDSAMRIAPPLTITFEEMKTACDILQKSIHESV